MPRLAEEDWSGGIEFDGCGDEEEERRKENKSGNSYGQIEGAFDRKIQGSERRARNLEGREVAEFHNPRGGQEIDGIAWHDVDVDRQLSKLVGEAGQGTKTLLFGENDDVIGVPIAAEIQGALKRGGW